MTLKSKRRILKEKSSSGIYLNCTLEERVEFQKFCGDKSMTSHLREAANKHCGRDIFKIPERFKK